MVFNLNDLKAGRYVMTHRKTENIILMAFFFFFCSSRIFDTDMGSLRLSAYELRKLKIFFILFFGSRKYKNPSPLCMPLGMLIFCFFFTPIILLY